MSSAMKRFLILAVCAIVLVSPTAQAWGVLGHQVIVEIAKRHITPKAKSNIAKYIPYDITKDAVYMDIHRNDKEIGYTTAWHVYNVDENGEYDFEALEAIDLELLNSDLERLTAGESVEVPRYDFITGTRQWHETPLKLTDRSILIMEGIHGLNPRLTPSIPREQKFCIYASCLTAVAMDNLSRISTSDNRLLRRITRDYSTRGANALATLQRWSSVRRGEQKHIFPYQENADVMFNSSLFYEISVLRAVAEPLLREVPDTEPEYAEARRMLRFLDNFTPIQPEQIPPTSLLREFIGGSSFTY